MMQFGLPIDQVQLAFKPKQKKRCNRIGSKFILTRCIRFVIGRWSRPVEFGPPGGSRSAIRCVTYAKRRPPSARRSRFHERPTFSKLCTSPHSKIPTPRFTAIGEFLSLCQTRWIWRCHSRFVRVHSAWKRNPTISVLFWTLLIGYDVQNLDNKNIRGIRSWNITERKKWLNKTQR